MQILFPTISISTDGPGFTAVLHLPDGTQESGEPALSQSLAVHQLLVALYDSGAGLALPSNITPITAKTVHLSDALRDAQNAYEALERSVGDPDADLTDVVGDVFWSAQEVWGLSNVLDETRAGILPKLRENPILPYAERLVPMSRQYVRQLMEVLGEPDDLPSGQDDWVTTMSARWLGEEEERRDLVTLERMSGVDEYLRAWAGGQWSRALKEAACPPQAIPTPSRSQYFYTGR